MTDERLALRPGAIVDPRGTARVQPVRLAPRPATLDRARILLFDNGKLDPAYGPYRAIADTIAAALVARATGVSVDELGRDLLKVDRPAIATLAGEIVRGSYTGAVIALCDSGVTQPSMLLAAALERGGVPTVAICQTTAHELAAATARAYAPGLPLPAIGAIRTATGDEVARETLGIVDEVIAGLTTPATTLAQRFHEQVDPERLDLDARDGELHLDVEQVVAPTRGHDGRVTARVDPAGFAEALYERLCDAVMTDGFPVIPPTRDRVDRMLAFTDREPQDVVVAELPPSGAAVTVEALAVAAVMAGCRPEYFPIVVTALDAMADERYRLFQAVITSHAGGNAVVVSGPLARELGIASGGGCLGPGHRANATIGRALTLCLLNVGRAMPGRSDLAVFGSPAEYSYCLAEAGDRTPWTPLHVDLADAATTTVTVHRAEAPHNVIDHLSTTPEGILGTVASVAATLGGNNAYMPAELLVLLNPEHARMVADAGWSKRDVQHFLFDHARNPAEALRGRGIAPNRPAWTRSAERIPVVSSPDEVLVIVAGGDGPQSMVAIPWGYARAVTRPVAFRDGRPIRSVGELARLRR
jgi:hypothetical protein